MKTLTILFEEPNVFKVLPEWPDHTKISLGSDIAYKKYKAFCEQSKVNAIRIEKGIEEIKYACYQSDERITGPCNPLFWEENILKHGDIFQVEGFEYEVNKHCMHDSCSHDGGCEHCVNEIELATLKLAKEEEPKG